MVQPHKALYLQASILSPSANIRHRRYPPTSYHRTSDKQMPGPPEKLVQFAGHKYLNLETYRRNGEAVRTPVWFAEDVGVLYIYSLAEAGKIKRIRRNPRVRIAPCTMRGEVRGDWVDAAARLLDGEAAARGDELLDRKYGWQRKLGNWMRRIFPKERVVVAINLD